MKELSVLKMTILMVVSFIPAMVMAQAEMLLLSVQLDALSRPQEVQENPEAFQAIKDLWKEERQGPNGAEYNFDLSEVFMLLVLAEKNESTRNRVLLNSEEVIEKVFNTSKAILETMLEKFKEKSGGKEPNPQSMGAYDQAWRSAMYEMISDISNKAIIPWISLADKAVNETNQSDFLHRIVINGGLLKVNMGALLDLSKVSDIDRYKDSLTKLFEALDKTIRDKQGRLQVSKGREKAGKIELPQFLQSEEILLNQDLHTLKLESAPFSLKFKSFVNTFVRLRIMVMLAKKRYNPSSSSNNEWKIFLEDSILSKWYNEGIIVWSNVLLDMINKVTNDNSNDMKNYQDAFTSSKQYSDEFLSKLMEEYLLDPNIYKKYVKLVNEDAQKVKSAIDNKRKELGLIEDWL